VGDQIGRREKGGTTWGRNGEPSGGIENGREKGNNVAKRTKGVLETGRLREKRSKKLTKKVTGKVWVDGQPKEVGGSKKGLPEKMGSVKGGEIWEKPWREVSA